MGTMKIIQLGFILFVVTGTAFADPTPEAPPEAQTPEPPPKPTTQDLIKTFCADKWGTDYRMQRYCIDKETVAYREVVDWIVANTDLRDGIASTPLDHIAIGCLSKWALPNDAGCQWTMVRYCINTQVEAYEALQ